jgi:hypothetical protein
VLLGAIGEGANRLIAASSPVQTRLYRSRDSGATWTQLEGVPAGRPRLAGDPANGALDLTWSFGPELRWTRLDDAHIAAPSPIVSLGESGELCTASSAAWTIDRGRGYERVPLTGEATFSMLPGAMRALACTDDQVLIATDEDVQRCDAEGCKVVVRGVPTKRFGYGAMVGDDVAYAGQQGAVAGVWRGDDVRFVRIPDTMRVQAVALWGGKPYLVLMGDKGAAVAAVP